MTLQQFQRKISGSFKGTCQHCRRRTTVRLYPYSYEEWLGVLCRDCFDYISDEISAGGT